MGDLEAIADGVKIETLHGARDGERRNGPPAEATEKFPLARVLGGFAGPVLAG